MDLWDVAKVMWRRRGVTVPLLLLTAVGAVFSLLTIPPTYSARAQVAFLTPAAAQGANPFNASSLAEFLSISLNRLEVRGQLGQEGLATDYRVTFRPDNLPLIGLEVVGRQEEAVARTVDRLIRMVEAETVRLQANIPPAQAITASVADRGDDLAVVRKAGRRALTIIAGIGLLITAAVALAVDALIRRRSRPAAPPPRQLIPRQSTSAMAASAAEPGKAEDPLAETPPAAVEEPGEAEARKGEDAPQKPGDEPEPKGQKAPVDLGDAVTILLDQNSTESSADNDVTIPLPLAGVSRSADKPKGALASKKSGETSGRGKKR